MGKIKLTFIIISAILLAIIVFLLLANFVYKPKALTSSLFIYFCKKGDTVRDAGLTTPKDIIRFDDIQYGSSPKWNILDIYGTDDAPQNHVFHCDIKNQVALICNEKESQFLKSFLR